MQTHSSPPTSPALAQALAAVQQAEAEVDTVLLAGEDSTAAHTALHHAKAALQEVRAAERAAAEAAAAEAAAERQQAEAEALARAGQEHAEAAARIVMPEGVDAPAEALPPAVAFAVTGLERARAAFNRARAAQAEASVPRDAAAARLAAAVAELSAIGTRRAAGDAQHGDDARVHTLTLDREHLQRALEPLQAAVDAVTAPVAEAQRLLQDAEGAVQQATAAADLGAMVARVRAIEAHFCDAVRTLRLEAQARGKGNFGSVFLPSTNLRTVANGGWL